MKNLSHEAPLKGSFITGAINGIINGIITWGEFKKEESVPMTIGEIGSNQVSAVGNAVLVGFVLTFIVSSITFFIAIKSMRKDGIHLAEVSFFPKGLISSLSNAFVISGIFLMFGVLWQRFMGTYNLKPILATLVLAMAALIAGTYADWKTKSKLINY